MDNNQLINELKAIPDLYGTCSYCHETFKIADATLFDGLCKSFPTIAKEICKQYEHQLKERADSLLKRKLSVKGAEQKAIDVGFGKIVEKVVPAYKNFPFSLCECRALFEPIDMIIFNGLSNLKVDSITFLEIKSGESDLNKHQRRIRDAVKEKNVHLEVI
jgi:predicted Holliday junction resolvase-like endonuclease